MIKGDFQSFGDKKLKALYQTMGFRRKILAKEWEHKRMRMLIQDLEEKLVDVKHVRVSTFRLEKVFITILNPVMFFFSVS